MLVEGLQRDSSSAAEIILGNGPVARGAAALVSAGGPQGSNGRPPSIQGRMGDRRTARSRIGSRALDLPKKGTVSTNAMSWPELPKTNIRRGAHTSGPAHVWTLRPPVARRLAGLLFI